MSIPLRTGEEAASYIVYRLNGHYYAKNARTGNIEFGGHNNVGGVSGLNAHAVIQAAINALGTDGGKIFIKEGTYDLDRYLLIPNYITLKGSNPYKTILRLSAALDPQLTEYPVISTERGAVNPPYGWNEGIVIENLTLDANGRNFRTIMMDCARKSVVRNCIIKGYINLVSEPATGLLWGWADDSLIENCYFEPIVAGGAGTGLAEHVRLTSVDYHRNLTVRNCYFEGSADMDRGITIENIALGGIFIVNNWFRNFSRTASDCIRMEGNAPLPVREIQILENYFKDSVRGITLGYVYDTLIEGNEFRTMADYAIAGSNYYRVAIKNNIIRDITTNYDGIGGETITDVLVMGNIIQDPARRGISLIDLTRGQIIGNSCLSGGQDGIYLEDCGEVAVLGNVCNGNARYGIYELGASDYNEIVGNNCRGNTGGALAKVGANTVVKHNLGYVTENKGIAVFPGGVALISVTHNMNELPFVVNVTPQADSGDLWVPAGSIGVTGFTIQSDINPAAGTSVLWSAWARSAIE